MLAKLTAGNRLTLPKAVVKAVHGAKYFDVTEEDGRIVLTPLEAATVWGELEDVVETARDKIEALGLTEADAVAAVVWARQQG